MGDLGSIPGLGRSPGEGKDYPLQYFGLENSMNYIVHRVAKTSLRAQIARLQELHLSLDVDENNISAGTQDRTRDL